MTTLATLVLGIGFLTIVTFAELLMLYGIVEILRYMWREWR